MYLVDAGDHIQGAVYGRMDEGRSVINIMNATGYDLAVPGDHELDYGMHDFFSRVAKAAFLLTAVKKHDHLAIYNYLLRNNGGEKYTAITSQNGPLFAYANYLLNDENLAGSKRLMNMKKQFPIKKG